MTSDSPGIPEIANAEDSKPHASDMVNKVFLIKPFVIRLAPKSMTAMKTRRKKSSVDSKDKPITVSCSRSKDGLTHTKNSHAQ